jgi:hypothetical protein
VLEFTPLACDRLDHVWFISVRRSLVNNPQSRIHGLRVSGLIILFEITLLILVYRLTAI